MARIESPIINTIAYHGVRLTTAAAQCFDVDHNVWRAGWLGDVWYRYGKKHRERAVANLRRSFPQLEDEQAQDLARRSMRHLMQMFVVDVHSAPRLLSPSTWPKYVRFGQVERAMEILLSNKPAIFVTGHCGNFEMLGFTLAVAGFPITAVARPLDLPRVNDWLLSVREKRGMTVLDKAGASEHIPDVLERGGRVAFIADQDAGLRGVFVPFFGHLASGYKTIALMAMRYQLPIVCGTARRRFPDRFQYEITTNDVIEPSDWEPRPDPMYYITARYTRAIENMVCRDPEQYFWVHRRWKTRPRHEREGVAFPPSLRDKLTSLPWLSESDVTRIVEASERVSMGSSPSADSA